MSLEKFLYTSRLRAGDAVKVRSQEEILATLDQNGMLDSMPFMPEMLRYCGQQFVVSHRADKTCDTIYFRGGLRLRNCVHLEGLRCDGQDHGGCDAACLFFWKEAWLTAVPQNNSRLPFLSRILGVFFPKWPIYKKKLNVCTLENIHSKASTDEGENDSSDITYMCQATELLRATTRLKWWDIRQYWRDIVGGNVTINQVAYQLLFTLLRKLITFGVGYRVLMSVYARMQKKRGCTASWPYKHGVLTKTPAGGLGLKPGELVEVKSHDEILTTLNRQNKNRGLYFGAAMVPYCGKQHYVLKKVNRIINEETGKMMELPNDCVILDGAICTSEFSRGRVFCPRAVYPYWREIWLKRVDN